jgi:hypothetical protein
MFHMQPVSVTNLLLVLDGLAHQDGLDALLHGVLLGALDVFFLG